MTQEEQKILLQDLCARLPYGVILRIADHNVKVTTNNTWVYFGASDEAKEYIKPYLRPMSSMTEEEMERLTDTHSLLSANGIPYNVCCTVEGMDYLNSIHVDYRGLIPMGLALEAPEDMYNSQKE